MACNTADCLVGVLLEGVMKVGLMSDTHDHIENTLKAVELFNNYDVGYVLHAGDIVSPFIIRCLQRLKAPWRVCIGNNPGDLELAYKMVEKGVVLAKRHELTIEGRTFLLLHYQDEAEKLCSTGGYDYVICGHTHAPYKARIGNSWLINPGAASYSVSGGHFYKRATVAVLDTASASVEYIDISTGSVLL